MPGLHKAVISSRRAWCVDILLLPCGGNHQEFLLVHTDQNIGRLFCLASPTIFHVKQVLILTRYLLCLEVASS